MIIILLMLATMCGATILIEGIPTLPLKDRKAWWKASVICNVVTNPILNVIILLMTTLWPDENWVHQVIILLEIVVVFLEAYFYRRMLNKGYGRCLLFSFIANALSMYAGIMFNYWIMRM